MTVRAMQREAERRAVRLDERFDQRRGVVAKSDALVLAVGNRRNAARGVERALLYEPQPVLDAADRARVGFSKFSAPGSYVICTTLPLAS